MRLTVKPKGVKAIIDSIEKYDKETTQRIGDAVNGSLKNIAKGIRTRLPSSKTGNLRRGIKKSYSKKRMSGEVKSTAPHAHLLEFGTKSHALTKGTSRDAGRAAKRGRKHVDAIMVISGNVVDGEHIIHPGSKPKPSMQPAYYAEKPNYIANIIKAVKPE